MNAVLHLSLTGDRKGNGKRAEMGKLIYMDHAATTAVLIRLAQSLRRSISRAVVRNRITGL